MSIETAYLLVFEKLEGWLTEGIKMLPNFLVAILVILIFTLLARLVRNLIERSFKRFRINSTIFQIFTTGIYFIIFSAGVFIALNVLQLSTAVTSLLAGAGIVGLALSFAFQDIATNLMAGVILALKKPMHEGDVIEIQGHEGTITSVGLRTTRLATFRGDEVIIPNKELIQNFVINYSREGVRRVDVAVGVAYDTDLELAALVVGNAIKALDFVLADRNVNVLWNEFGDSSINCSVNFWVKYHTNIDYTSSVSEGIVAIKKAFDANNINIPFPIRTVYMAGEKRNHTTAAPVPAAIVQEKEL